MRGNMQGQRCSLTLADRDSGKISVIIVLLVLVDSDAKTEHLAVEPEIVLPLLVQLDGVTMFQYAQIDMGEFGT